MDPITDLLTAAGKSIGLSPVAIGFGLLAISRVSAAITKAIPDNATGWRHYVRIGTKIIGLYVKDNTGLPVIQTGPAAGVKQEVITDAEEVVEQEVEHAVLPNLFTSAAAASLTQEK